MKLKGVLIAAVGFAVSSCERPAGAEEEGAAGAAGDAVEEGGGGGDAGKEREIEIAPGVKMVLVWCPPGSVTRQKLNLFNEPEGGREDVFRLTKGFWVGKYEVTQEQWAAVMGTNPSEFKGRTLPVETVSWDDAQAFLAKSGKGLRLPTAAEWEYACRAGSTTAYCFGDDEAELGEYAWYGKNSDQTNPVGKKKANAWGIHDMHGNVWEWCQDFYGEDYWAEDYKGSRTDPAGSKAGSYRVFRGGSWDYYGGHCRSASRTRPTPAYRAINLGFRVAVSSTE